MTNRVWNRVLRIGILVVTLIGMLWCGGQSPAAAIALGDTPGSVSLTTRVGRQGVRVKAVEEHSQSHDVQAALNGDGEVFLVQVQSSEQEPPRREEFMGPYQECEKVKVFPLRGRIDRCHQGNREAEWAVFGQSGNFNATALSRDLAPPETME